MVKKPLDEIMIGEGWVMHHRPSHPGAPVKNAFRYPIFNLNIPIRADGTLDELSRRGIISLRPQDYLDGKATSLQDAIRSFLHERINYSCDEIRLQTLPRMFGYAFNPVSFWFCFRSQCLDAVLCEVNNTFGERHFYFIREPNTPSSAPRTSNKSFHVSPFFDLNGKYTFEFNLTEESSDIRIRLHHDDALRLDTRIKLRWRPLREISTFAILRRYGWITAMVILRIHFQALRLWLKGARYHRKPEPPTDLISGKNPP